MKEFSLSRFFYYLVVALLFLILVREYTYVHPYNPGWGAFGPKWKYASTMTFTWCFLLIASFLLIFPLIKKRKHGFLGLTLLLLVAIRPLIQDKFPEETAKDFYLDRKEKLNKMVQSVPLEKNEYSTDVLANMGFEQLIVEDSIYFFFFYNSEDFPFGLCYKEGSPLPSRFEKFNRTLEFTPIVENWYEVDYTD